MNVIVILTAILLVFAGATPAGAQDNKDSSNTKDKSGLGSVLDKLGGLLGAGTNSKLHGSVVLAHDTTLVLRTDDKRSVRVDTGSIDPQVRQQLAPGQPVTVTARGSSGSVLTASDVQVEQGKAAPEIFSRVVGTVQERSDNRVLFKTKEGLTLPIDTSRISGLPYLAANTPATLIYEQGSQQEVIGVWIEPGDAMAAASSAAAPASASSAPAASPSASSATSPSASLPSASVPTGEKLEGLVESVGMSDITVQTTDGRHIRVDTADVDRTTLASVRPGDIVTVTGKATTDPESFTASSVTRSK